MVKIKKLLEEGKVSRIAELELERYVSFFDSSSMNNLEHCNAVLDSFPRWNIISGYYAMHDLTKLLLAKAYRLKVDYEVHATAIAALYELLHDREVLGLLEHGYKEFIFLANDLAQAKKERVRVQYYTGTPFMKEEYRKRAAEFLSGTVEPFIAKMNRIIGQQ